MNLGRYQILREIARSNDIVYEAHDPQMNRRVAVKELSLAPELMGAGKIERIERFKREARAAGALEHPNIVTIHDVGEEGGRYFIAMEYLEGQTLRERLTGGGPLPLVEAVQIAAQLCDALEYAHRAGIVHRDIKPDNVHLVAGNRAKLTDFGIARILHESQLTVAGQIFGTPSYMSPEQIKGGTIDARTDIFSLGILLYEMVTGRKPFTGDSVVTITYKIISEAMPHAPGATPALDAVIQRATQKEPNLRFQSAQELREALQAVSQSRTGVFAAAPHLNASYAAAPLAPPSNATVQYGTQTQFALPPQAPIVAEPVAQAPIYVPDAPPAPAKSAAIWAFGAASGVILVLVGFLMAKILGPTPSAAPASNSNGGGSGISITTNNGNGPAKTTAIDQFINTELQKKGLGELASGPAGGASSGQAPALRSAPSPQDEAKARQLIGEGDQLVQQRRFDEAGVRYSTALGLAGEHDTKQVAQARLDAISKQIGLFGGAVSPDTNNN